MTNAQKQKWIEAVRRGDGIVMMHREYGDILIAWPESAQTLYTESGLIKHSVYYHLEGPPGHVYAGMQGKPGLYNFEFIGTFNREHFYHD